GKTTKAFLLGGIGILGIFATNVFWIFPILRSRAMLETAFSEPYFLETFSLQSWYLQKDVSRLTLLVFGLLGLKRWIRTRRDIVLPYTVGVLSLLGLMFFLKEPRCLLLQRFRYDWPLSLFLSLPASDFIIERSKSFSHRWRHRKKELFSRMQRTGFFLLYATILAALIFSDRSRYLFCTSRLFLKDKTYAASLPLPTAMRPPELDALLVWVQKYQQEEGRLLLEETHHPHHTYWGIHLPAILPHWTKREIVNPPLPEMPLQVAKLGFVDGVLFGKPIEEFSSKEFQEYLQQYNIRWIICFSPTAKRYLEDQPLDFIRKEALIAHLSCYSVNRPSNYFLKGSGKVFADFNRLVLKEVKADSGEVIVSYHWLPGLRTVPERKIEKAPVKGDPVGFIKILDPPETLEIVL
ncbi:MAG: hypothetical protein ABH845_04525, partial [Candidatus Omnitrophota bacterium]